jgi:HK97 family phage prohead protease
MPQYVDARRFRELVRDGDAAGVAVERLGSVARAANNGSRVITFCFSDGSTDRMNDRIDPYGWDTSAFQKNPVCLWAHDATAPPIGRVRRTYISGDRFMGDIEFASAETYPFADQIYRLVVDGFVKAVSVGFLPIEWQWADDDKSRPGGINFERQELLEISVCPIPANANALVQAAVKSLARRHSAPTIRPPALSTLSYAGTLQQRQALLHFEHPKIERDAAIAAADPATREGRIAIARAHRRYGERLMRQ